MAAGLVINLPLLTQASEAADRFTCEDVKQHLMDPFAVPANAFLIREKLLLQKKERISDEGVPGYSKSTYASRRKISHRKQARLICENDAEEDKVGKEDCMPPYSDTGDTSMKKSGVKEYIHQQRHIILLQYTIGVKEKSIAALEQTAHEIEQQLINDEKQFERHKLAVENLMVESQNKRTEALLRVEENTNAKDRAIAAINKATDEVQRLKGFIEQQQQELNYCLTAKMFFEELAPEEWKEKKRKEKMVSNNRTSIGNEIVLYDPLPPKGLLFQFLCS
ncbi:uncharacterized protein LOC119973778 [Scyliorhinus canicula]|uniref:uncharacterized protein LOC119973778 n=1 Tax=Scyliorhinus canicula TaxID=7830 RepID=UPI0018F78F08|nr:uncharacterized protein LOC119973778 [Scyliorhinus canicula]